MNKIIIIAAFTGFVAFSMSFIPQFWWHLIIFADYWLNPHWKAFSSPVVKFYHEYLLSTLPDREEQNAIEIPLELATKEYVEKVSKGYTVPIIIRKALINAPALSKWTNKEWWLENYGNESVLCKYVEKIGNADAPACTVKDSFGSLEEGSGSANELSHACKKYRKSIYPNI